MSMLRKFVEDYRKKVDSAFITVHDGGSTKEILIKDIPDRSLSWEDRQNITTNNLGWKLLFPKYTNDALVKVTEYYLNNCSKFDPVTYEGALISIVVPELLSRFRELNEKVKE